MPAARLFWTPFWFVLMAPLSAVLFLGFGPLGGSLRVASGVLILGEVLGWAGIVVGIRRYRPVSLLPWWCLLAYQGLICLGCTLAFGSLLVPGMTVPVDVSYAFFLAGYPPLIAALLLWSHRRRVDSDTANWIDLGIVAVSAGIPSVLFTIEPTVTASGDAKLQAVVAAANPVFDLVLVVAVVKLILTPSRLIPSLALLCAAIGLQLLGDTANLLAALDGLFAEMPLSPPIAPLLASAPLFAAAALHPSMALLSESPASAGPPVSGQRVATMTILSLVPPAILVIGSDSWASWEIRVVGGGCAALTGLVLLRVWLLVVGQRQLAVTDGLTGLHTRRFFDEALVVAMAGADRVGNRVGLLMLDADHFKQVNDKYGHQAGDVVLKEIAQRLTKSVRLGDVVARYGGEEFAAIVTATNAEQLQAVAERVRQSICGTPVALQDGSGLQVTVSIGVAASPDNARTPEQLTLAADESLYRAKADGRNRVVVAAADAFVR
ncbi:diguanylate cyclase [Cryptosporangium sp. NPDC051539]|uniref:diguanylate cyclase n=1 Tax=Cryptosporangium sp. NPDC051539 TaxID=3363962 RepID=UPI003796CF7F